MWGLVISNTISQVFRTPRPFERVIPNPKYGQPVPALSDNPTPQEVAQHLMDEVQAEAEPATLTITYPAEVFTLWTEEERRSIGLLPINQDPIPDPWFHLVAGSTFEVLEAAIQEHWDLVEPSAEERAHQKLAAVSERRSALEGHFLLLQENGVEYPPASGRILQMRDDDRANITAKGAEAKFALMLNASWPSQFGWIMKDNELLPLTAQGMSDLADFASIAFTTWIFIRRQKKTALEAMIEDPTKTIYDIRDFDIEGGWNVQL